MHLAHRLATSSDNFSEATSRSSTADARERLGLDEICRNRGVFAGFGSLLRCFFFFPDMDDMRFGMVICFDSIIFEARYDRPR